MQTTGRWYWKPLLCQLSHKHFKITLCIIFWVVTVVIMALITTFCYKILFRLLGWRIVCGLRQQITLKTLWEWRWWSARSPSSLTIQVRCMLTSWLFFFLNSQMSDKQMKTNWLLCTTEQKIIQHMHGNVPCMSNYWSNLVVCLPQCDQKKSPNVYKNCPKMISLEKW